MGGLVQLWEESYNLNRYAGQGDIETITKKINGGKNGFDDRVERFALGAGCRCLRREDARGIAYRGSLGSEGWRWVSHLPTSFATL
ncbi:MULTISPECIES: hypothetical protein [Rhizobium]|uniref:Uncharacterized protein n=1 Tax=Rhizobium favelukesii TaxID=348824 RepID=W6RJK2_9HYPH|nr:MULTISPECIES: hypothetical protein [Rhizobium]MCS0463632.1 hypothetical protein [Rhizobium favelukesii]UFS85325.1 hypothetical protein LPB79_37365 [Rhizobium sp. T136]CDM61347.1 hypothetical protein LPU83_pLPU83c_0785 [Rhizobium favelukesii]